MSCFNTWVEIMTEETWESTAINVGGKANEAVGRSPDHMWGVHREFLAKMFNNISIQQISEKLWGDRVSVWHAGSTTISIQNSEKLRESVRVCLWDKMLNEHFHSNPQGGRDLFTHQKIKFLSQLLHAQPPPPPQRNRCPKSNGLNPTSGIFP